LLVVETSFYGLKSLRGNYTPKEKQHGKPHEKPLCENCANGDCDEVEVDKLVARLERL